LLAVERTNNDIIIFIFLYWSAIFPNIFGAILNLLATAVEFWPALGGISFIKKKIKLYLISLLLIFFIYNFKTFCTIYPEVSIYATFSSKTLQSFFFVNISFFRNKIFLYKFLLIFLTIITLVKREWNFFNFEFKREHSELEQRFFLMGASIYCVLFMIECNFDYKLIFLIFCIP
jgi:hypothetical protein